MTDSPTNEQCFICGDSHSNRLQTHHVVPRRYGGSDDPENLVTLCASCHQGIEKLYDERFYERLHTRSVDAPRNELEAEGMDVENFESPDRRLDPMNPHIVALDNSGERVENWGEFEDIHEMHCGYCSTRFEPHQHALAARHLRINHGIGDPYKLNTVYLSELYAESRNRAQDSRSRLNPSR